MKKGLSGLLLDFIIILLCISMLNLVFMHAARSINDTSGKEQIFNDLWMIQGYDGNSFASFDFAMCLPDSISYKQSGKQASAVVGDNELMKTVYSVLSNVITDIFGSDSVANRFDGDINTVYNKVASADSYVFFSYATELPFPCIYAFSSGSSNVTYEMSAKSDAFYVSDVALLLDTSQKEVTYRCFAFDRHQNVYEFTRADGTQYVLPGADIAHIDAYSEDFTNVDFAMNRKADFDKLSLFPLDILYGSLDYSYLNKTFAVSELELSDTAVAKKFLEIFDINSEKTNTYSEDDGTKVYIGTDDRLEITSDGLIKFTNTNSPIEIKEIIGFSPSKINSYTAFDMLKTASVIINKLSDLYPSHFGGNATPKLTSIYKDSDGRYVFEYSYYISGFRINTEPAYKFVFTSSGLTELSADASSYEETSQKSATLPKALVYERLNEIGASTITSRITPIYTLSGDTIKINWFSSEIIKNQNLS